NTPPVVALKSKSSRSVQSSLESRLRESFYWVTLSSDEHSFRIGAALAVDQYRLLTPTATMSQLLELSESMSGQVCNVMDRSIAPVDALAFHETWLGNQEIDETSLAILPDLLSQYRSNGSDPKSEIGRKLTVVYQRAIAAQNALRSLGVGLLRVKEPLKHHMDRFGNDRERDLWIEGPSATVRKMVKSPLVGPFYDPEEVLVDKQTNFNWTKLNVRFLIGLPLVSTQTTGQRTGPFFRIGKVSMGKNSSLDLSGAAVLDDQGRFAGMLTSPSTLPVENRGKFEALLDPDDVAYDWVPRDTI
ncbi:unnamed protein product, partial [Hapterophycus canaliculatus]